MLLLVLLMTNESLSFAGQAPENSDFNEANIQKILDKYDLKYVEDDFTPVSFKNHNKIDSLKELEDEILRVLALPDEFTIIINEDLLNSEFTVNKSDELQTRALSGLGTSAEISEVYDGLMIRYAISGYYDTYYEKYWTSLVGSSISESSHEGWARLGPVDYQIKSIVPSNVQLAKLQYGYQVNDYIYVGGWIKVGETTVTGTIYLRAQNIQ